MTLVIEESRSSVSENSILFSQVLYKSTSFLKLTLLKITLRTLTAVFPEAGGLCEKSDGCSLMGTGLFHPLEKFRLYFVKSMLFLGFRTVFRMWYSVIYLDHNLTLQPFYSEECCIFLKSLSSFHSFDKFLSFLQSPFQKLSLVRC